MSTGTFLALDVYNVHLTVVDAVALQAGHQGRESAHHPVAEVAVERIVGAEGRDLATLGQLAHLEPGRGHGDAQAFGLGRAGDHAAVVVR